MFACPAVVHAVTYTAKTEDTKSMLSSFVHVTPLHPEMSLGAYFQYEIIHFRFCCVAIECACILNVSY